MQKPSVESIKKKIAKMGEVYSPGNASKKGHLYNPLPFPEFKGVPSQREAVYDRWKIIKPHLFGHTALDIGCHTGFNCFMLDREGYKCTGIEAHKLSAEIADDVAQLYGLDIDFIEGKATPELINNLGQFDVCFFLSTFQWITKDKGFDYAKDVLKAATENSKVLFFETSMGNEGKAKMPMLPDVISVLQMLWGVRDGNKRVEYLGDVIAPGGISHPKRSIFKIC